MTLPTPAYRYRATLHRVIDGDTYELDVDCGFAIRARLPIRLRGYSCPERCTGPGKRATHAAAVRLGAQPLLIETEKIREKDVQSFARYVADIWTPDGHLGELLAAEGHASREETSS